MKGVYVDVNSRAVQIVGIGPAQDYTAGEIVSGKEHNGIVRFKNITEDEEGRIRIRGKADAGVVIGPGETEYFGIYADEDVEIISGTFNVM